jgi:acetylornithine/succinyldiaminopimelate/putrescine aminotransferase
MLIDEIQTGVGRTGRFLGIQHVGVTPDALTLAKGLGGGVPIGAMLCTEKLSKALPPGSHGSTFGGNPLASSVALSVLDEIEAGSLISHAAGLGDYLAERLSDLAKRSSQVNCARGQGLLQALVLEEGIDARVLVSELREAGVLVTLAGARALRLSPALIITRTELDEGLEIIASVLERAA